MWSIKWGDIHLRPSVIIHAIYLNTRLTSDQWLSMGCCTNWQRRWTTCSSSGHVGSIRENQQCFYILWDQLKSRLVHGGHAFEREVFGLLLNMPSVLIPKFQRHIFVDWERYLCCFLWPRFQENNEGHPSPSWQIWSLTCWWVHEWQKYDYMWV